MLIMIYTSIWDETLSKLSWYIQVYEMKRWVNYHVNNEYMRWNIE